VYDLLNGSVSSDLDLPLT